MYRKTFESDEFDAAISGSIVVTGVTDPDATEPAGEVEIGRPGSAGTIAHPPRGSSDSIILTSRDEVEQYLSWHDDAVRTAARAAGLLPEADG